MTNSPHDPVDWHAHWEAQATRRSRRPAGMGALVFGVVALMALLWLAINWRSLWSPHGAAPLMRPAAASKKDTEVARFDMCHASQTYRVNCVVDGDTIWYHHQKIRVADINAPEVSEPQCDAELALGEKATDRILELLNAGPFSLVASESRDVDKYGRLLRTITRGGQSLGAVMVSEGLAEKWVGYRRNWCGG